MSDEENGFAARWSKRKISARQAEKKPNDGASSGTNQESEESKKLQDDHVVKSSEEELLTEEDFEDVDFENLDKSSDYTRFAKGNVPASIQQKAFRKLWESDSVFDVLDGMNDYDEDFTGDGLGRKALKTAYQAGRGYLIDEEEIEDVAEKEEANSDSNAIADIQQPETLEVDSSDDNIETKIDNHSEVPS